jgi:hypothetical protein
MKKKLREILEAFDINRVKSAILIYDVLLINGYTMESLRRFVDQISERDIASLHNFAAESRARSGVIASKYPACPQCGKRMAILEVNTRASNQIGEAGRSMWQCVDPVGCGYEQVSGDTIHVELQRYGIITVPQENRPLVVQPIIQEPAAPLSRRRRSVRLGRVRPGCGENKGGS